MVKVFPNTPLIINNVLQKSPITKGLIKAQNLNAEFFSITNKKMQKGYVTIRELKATLSKFLPSDIKLKIIPLEPDSNIGGYWIGVFDEMTLGLTNDIPNIQNLKDAKFGKDKLHLIMHETFHLFKELTEPKFKARLSSDKYLIAGTTKKFFYKYVYPIIPNQTNNNWQKTLEKRLNKYLSTLSSEEEQIDALQRLRYKIIDEALAFNESVKYGADVNYNKEFAFKDKYSIIEKVLIEKFKDIRG